LQRAWKKVEEGMVGFVNVKTDYRARATTVRFRAARPEVWILRNQKFADSPLEGNGFELPVPPDIGSGFRGFAVPVGMQPSRERWLKHTALPAPPTDRGCRGSI
jgi:hypothetical protein